MNRATLRILTALAVLTLAACGPDDPTENNNPGENNPIVDAGDGGVDPDGGGDDPDGGGDDPDGGGPVDPPSPSVEVVSCETLPAAPAGALCDVVAGSADTLVIKADILSGNTVYEGGTVVVDRSGENGEITYAGCMPPATDGATVLTCAGAVLSPGLLNAHDHITFNNNGAPRDHGTERFDHRHDWRTGKRDHNRISSGGGDSKTESVLYSELRHIFAGTTSIAGSGSGPGLARNLDRSTSTGGLSEADVDYSTFPLGDTSGTLRTGDCDYRGGDDADALNSAIFLPHIAEGIDPEANNEFRCLSGAGEFDLIAENTSVIHGIGLTANDIALMAQRGSKLVWSPRSNIDLYGQTADVLTYRRQGVTIAMGTDWLLSGSANMLRELACADYLNTNHYNDTFSDYELWRMATIDAAVALGIDSRIGDIAVGKVADLALFAKGSEQAHGAIVRGGVETVGLVLRGGQPLYGAGPLIEALVPAADLPKCEEIDICGNAQRACVELDVDKNIAGLRAEVSGTPYDLAPCGVPADEPSCVPFRPGEYEDGVTATDGDGDGIADSDDICPEVFNPANPLASNAQPDFDADSAGDSCDICPTEAGVTMCAGFDPDDRDGDGIANGTDNCPGISNEDQADGDADGIGDLCDGCPIDDNSDGTCDVSIYDIKQDRVDVGQTVKLSGVVVSASGSDGIFLQVPAGSDGFTSVDFSGIFVFGRGNENLPAAGDVIDIVAKVSTFSDQVQLQDIASIDVTSSGPRPAPVTETVANLLNSGSRGVALEGVLVRVDDVTVASIDADNGEFELTGGLFVDNALTDLGEVQVGDSYQAIIGGLSFRFGENRIEPGGPTDLITGPASLGAFSAAQVAIAENATASVTINLTGFALTDREITLGYSSAAISGPATVTVPQGQNAIAFDVTGVTAGQAANTLTATLGADSATTSISVYNDTIPTRAVASLTPTNANATVGAVTNLTATLNAPAPAGFALEVTVTGAAATAPASVTAVTGALEVAIPVTGASMGQVTVAVGATGQANAPTSTVDVSTLPAECLAISHYVEGASNDKVIEVRNCGTASVDMGIAGLCRFTNGATDSCSFVSLGAAGDMLATGEVVVLCNGNSSAAIKAVCDKESGTINHNGNDGYVLLLDDNGDGDFNPASAADDTVLDAFGARGDSTDFAKDVTHARCDDAPYDGTSDFAAFLSSNYVSSAQGDITDLGSATKTGCP